MKRSRTLVYWLLLVLAVGSLSCNYKPKTTSPQSYTLHIDENCNVKDQQAHVGDYLTWTARLSTESIRFQNNYTPISSTTPHLGVDEQVTQAALNSTGCKDPSHPTTASACYFPYDVLNNNAKCGDPGIQVIP